MCRKAIIFSVFFPPRVTTGLDTKVGLENVARLALTEFGLEHGPRLAISMVRLEILLAWIKYEHTLLVE